MGKGDTPRPMNKARYDKNYEKIYGDSKAAKNRRELFKQARKEAKLTESFEIDLLADVETGIDAYEELVRKAFLGNKACVDLGA